MDTRMISVHLTTNMNVIKNILIVPEVWERAAEPAIDPETFIPGYDIFNAWLMVAENGKPIGAILVSKDTSASVNIHPYLLPDYRHKVREMMTAFYDWFLESMDKSVEKVNVTIPTTDKKLYNCAKKAGFIEEGINRHSYARDGIFYDQWNLGITKSEIESCHK